MMNVVAPFRLAKFTIYGRGYDSTIIVQWSQWSQN
jgi:hypothetical protein